MQKKRPRRTGKQTATPGGPAQPPGTPPVAPAAPAAPAVPVGKGRATHVRNRLIAAVAVVTAAVAAAGAPSVIAASGQLSDSQDLVTLAGQTQDALALAHSLADERDEVTSYVAAGRPKSKAPSEQRSTRVDRQVDELRTDPDIPSWLRTDLNGVAAVRRSALTGQSNALQVHQEYSATIAELHKLAEQLAEQMPARAGSGAHALAELDTAVQQAAAARGLLLAALNVPHSSRPVYDPLTGLTTRDDTSSAAGAKQRDALSAAAQQARVRSEAALAEFRDTAPETARDSYDSTVTGAEAKSGEDYLKKLTAQPTLGDDDLDTDVEKADAALSARVDLMRGAESSLYDHRTKDLEALRDDDVTALEIRVALLGALLLLTIGVATALARTLTRPLAVLRLGSARLAGAEDATAEEAIRFTGRNDEFAQVVRSVNTLHARAAALAERIATLETDRKHLIGQRQKMADAREELRAELDAAATQVERLRTGIGSTFVNLALRTLGLVERQLAVIEGLEEREQDPDRLATLFKLDHFATVMRRHSENLLVLAGSEHVQQHAGPVPLVDVVRAAVSEIERYERVRIAALPPHAHVAGFAADDLSHLLAELMENATSFSPPDQPVEVSGWLLENGEIMLSVQDEGIGMAAERLSRLNARLADFDPEAAYDHESEDGLGLGLYVVARLAHRHGARVRLREQKQGGIAAVVVVPQPLLASAPAAAVPTAGPSLTTTGTVSLPGADAEANSNVLHARAKDGDPLVQQAEAAVRRAEAAKGATPPADSTAAAPAQPPADAGTPTPAEPPAGIPPESPAETTMELLLPSPTASTEHSGTGEHTTASGSAQSHPAPDGASAEAHPAPGAFPAQSRPASPASDDAGTGPRAAHDASGPDSHAAPAPGDSAPHPARERTEPAPHPAGDGHASAPYAAGTAPAGTAPAGAAPVRPRSEDAENRLSADGGADAADVHERAEEDQLTAKGLPKRTPRISTPTQAPRQRTGSVDADALRRRLGGFRKGALAGQRDVQAEIAERTGQNQRPDPAATRAHAEESTGGTVEEASS
ncbi:sensor histidine kinase [Streptomyces sennicomposti]|uniref:sensor histidine kinase n=1 Tax=Streptomyces sennicomposti TaxID=2873384 RepID=UPI001CA6FABC|nr:nitrate- and nitrite sensing domain-containing protein [Streptomyces sennicomposti]MBY8866531.1 nitrate- and nitrite sensing domain-containing protein [Streptomyces sennicomposti]